MPLVVKGSMEGGAQGRGAPPVQLLKSAAAAIGCAFNGPIGLSVLMTRWSPSSALATTVARWKDGAKPWE